ncbi:MAG: alpha/beta hydrolase [Solirubrobacteraceae bacterium]|nr:alpha/beta hydrolase [Solirubrobacteraceae bacterium]
MAISINRTNILTSAVAFAASAGGGATAAEAAPAAKPTGGKPTVVLVHGAFADASGWSKTAKRLRRDGYAVRTVANPLRGIAFDAATVRSVLDAVEGPKVLVGHSYGGAVITAAASGRQDVKALTYIAAFAPDQGEPLGALLERPVDHPIAPLALVPAEVHLPDGSVQADLSIDPSQFRAQFAGDLPADEAEDLALAQRPLNAAAFGEPLTVEPAWKTIPSWYIVAGKDRAIAPDLERFMAARAKAKTVEVKGASHVVFMSQPEAVVKVIEQAARAAR